MLNLFSDLQGFAIQAHDGSKGSVDDIYFDGDSWLIRYVIADISPIFFGRKALIGTELLGKPEIERRAWPVDLSKAEIEDAPKPGPRTAESVSEREDRRMREEREGVWPAFLLGPEGAPYTPGLAEEQLAELRRIREERRHPPEPKANLRSMAEVRGYKVRAKDDWVGTVDDFVIDPLDWQVRFIAIDTGDWLPGKRVVVSVGRLSDIDWNRGEIKAELTRDRVETSPSIDHVSELERSSEFTLLG